MSTGKQDTLCYPKPAIAAVGKFLQKASFPCSALFPSHQLKQPEFFIFWQWRWTFIYFKGKLLRKSIFPEGLYAETMPQNTCLFFTARNFCGWCFQRLFVLFSLGTKVRVSLRNINEHAFFTEKTKCK